METCATTVYSANKDAFESKSTSSSTECKFRGDFFGNIQPHRLVYRFKASFRVDMTSFGENPPHIQEFYFGVTDASVTMLKRNIHGKGINSLHLYNGDTIN
ncbi:hypothetical protein DPMN_153552 [Dreissena polymorpha]|uniref:Uncharacterized protein n=1 Tax=Dreissena polymorpha TaxID=45954 RepID=A0A9D4FJD3_DREPO|nr:hypothetical protein DPMN_153552 [Dreissena polymorpha]